MKNKKQYVLNLFWVDDSMPADPAAKKKFDKQIIKNKRQKTRSPLGGLAALASSEFSNNREKKRKVTLGSRLVSHASTNSAQRCLTSLIGREAVFPTWYEPCMERRAQFCNKKLPGEREHEAVAEENRFPVSV